MGRLVPRPVCVIATGDLTDCGLRVEYAEVAEALAQLPVPAFLIPGNHDRCDVMREWLGTRHSYLRQDPRFLHYVIDDFPVRLIALDTVVAGETGGEICAAREAWLAEVLARGEGRPTLIFMHHPPFRTGLPAMDTMLCKTSPTFAPLIARHPEVERIVAGHCHRPIVVRFAGTVGFVAPSTAHQVVLDFRSEDDNRFIHEPPGLALHVHAPGLGIVTHVAVVDDYGPIHSFKPPPEYPGRRKPVTA
jgi:3',5'-cyclic AMP phosphodiesterase CpdA